MHVPPSVNASKDRLDSVLALSLRHKHLCVTNPPRKCGNLWFVSPGCARNLAWAMRNSRNFDAQSGALNGAKLFLHHDRAFVVSKAHSGQRKGMPRT